MIIIIIIIMINNDDDDERHMFTMCIWITAMFIFISITIYVSYIYTSSTVIEDDIILYIYTLII